MREVTLSNISEMKYGKMPPKEILIESEEGFPVYSGYRITGYAKEFLYKDEMLVIVARGVGGTGDVKISPPESWITNLSIVLTVDEKQVDKYYLKYLLNREKLKDKLNTGAAQAQITIDSLSGYKIKLPALDVQKRVVDIVLGYENLIENNRRRIQLLEESARLLYKEWFVQLRFPGHEHVKIIDGVPEGWEKQALGSFVEVKKGKNITQETVEAGNVPVVAGGLKPAYYHSKANVNGPVITVSASGANAGYVNLYQQDIWASDCSYISREVDQHIYFRYVQLKNAQVEIFGMQHGAAQPHVYPKDVERLVVYQPTKSLVELFEGLVSDQFELIRKLQAANIQLAQARDILLPRLMNGELAV